MSRDYTPTRQHPGRTHSPVPNRFSPEKRPSLSCVSTPNAMVSFVLAAEFDSKVGAVVRHQVPRKLPGFKEHLGTVGELMIPSSSEHRDNAYSVFVLYRDSRAQYRLLPDSDVDLQEEGTLGFQKASYNEISTIFEKTSHNDDVLFFFTLTKSVEQKSSERGRVIRAVSIGTPLRNFSAFKHLLTLTAQLYVKDGQLSHLVSLFNTINSTDTAMWRAYLTANPHLYNILSLSYPFNSRLVLTHFKNINARDLSSQSVKYKDGVLQYFPQYDLSHSPEDAVMAKIPLHLSLTMHPTDIITDINVTQAIMKFLYEVSSKLNSIDYKNLKILVYSSASIDFLTSFILTLSNFLNGFNNTYFHNDRILYFPLIDLYSWEKVVEFDTHTKNTKIIGTNNIILKDNTDFYDFFYDLDTEVLTASEKLEMYPLSLGKTHDFMELTKTLHQQHHDYTTIRVSLQRFNLWEIIKILNRSDTDASELNLKDYYLSRNKNLVIFEEFFELKTINLIDHLSQLIKLLPIPFESLSDQQMSTITQAYDFFYTYISHSSIKGRLEMFLYLLEIFPLEITSPQDLVYDVELSLQSQLLINDIFKPLLINSPPLQRKIMRLYNFLCKSPLRIVLEQRLNAFTLVMLEEHTRLNKFKT